MIQKILLTMLVITAVAFRCGVAAAKNEIFCGGVSGCSDLSVPANSDDYREDGGHIYIHSVGWTDHTTEAQKNAIISLWQGHQWGIEMGFSSNNYTSRQNAYKRRYLDRGIQAKFITVNAYSSSRIPEVDDWVKTIQAYYDKGVAASTAIYATFEYQNMPGYMNTLMNNLVSDRTDFQQIIEASGGMTIDIPPTVYFRRIGSTNSNTRKYHDWILDAIRWAKNQRHTVGIIVSPNSSKRNYDDDTEAFIRILQEENALPDFFIVENYSPEDPSTYINEVGNEDTPYHQLGCARLIQTKWFTPPESNSAYGMVAHWPLDEGTGTAAVDASGNENTGTLLNGAVWGSDAVRSCYVSFDGVDDRISTAFRYSLSSGDNFTWAWWANKQSAAGTDGGAVMIGNRYPERSSGNKYGFIKLMPAETQFANTDAAADIDHYDYADIAPGGWHHYAMIKSGTTYQWYVDGAAQGSPETLTYSESFKIPLLIGGDGDNKPNEHFRGFIDDVVLYKRALSASEVVNVQNGIYTPIVTMVDLINVDNFENYDADTIMDGITSPGTLGGYWDCDYTASTDWNAPKAGRVDFEGDNKILYQEYKHNGITALSVNGLHDPIEDNEAGVLFFRFKPVWSSNALNCYFGVHTLTGNDPLPTADFDYHSELIAGIHLVSSGSNYAIKSLDDSVTLMSDLARAQWYSVWLAVNNITDTYDVYIEPADDGAGYPGLPKADPVGSELAFSLPVTEAITGGLWQNRNGADANIKFDQVAWAGGLSEPLPETYGNDGWPWEISDTGTTRIEAEDYNVGGEGVSYHDTTTGNTAVSYRAEDVDIGATVDAGGGYNVGYIDAGEWLEYSIDIARGGIYNLTLRTARQKTGSSAIRVRFDRQDKTGVVPIPSTGDWNIFTDVEKVIKLSSGRQLMRTEFVGGSYNFNWIELEFLRPDPDFAEPGGVGVEDFVHFSRNWLRSGCFAVLNNSCHSSDLDSSGSVDVADLHVLVDLWLDDPVIYQE